MLNLYFALSLLMSAGTILHGASSSVNVDAEADGAMLARMTAKAAARVCYTESDDPIEQLIAHNSQRAQAQFSPELAVEALQKFNATLASGTICPASLFVPVASTSSELQQCFKLTHVRVPSRKPLSFKTIMVLTPDPAGNKLETVMLASSNEPLLDDVSIKTVLGALEMLTGSAYPPREQLLYSVLGDTIEICKNYRDRGGNLASGPYASMLCGDLPFYNVSDIQGSSFEFTSQTAPADPVLMAHALLPAYLGIKLSVDMTTYVGALDMFAKHFAADKPHHMAPVLVPDVKRLQAYLARTDIPGAVIVDHKELTDPAKVLSETHPTIVSYLHPHEWRRGMGQATPSQIVIPQSVRLNEYLAKLPETGFTEE